MLYTLLINNWLVTIYYTILTDIIGYVLVNQKAIIIDYYWLKSSCLLGLLLILRPITTKHCKTTYIYD